MSRKGIGDSGARAAIAAVLEMFDIMPVSGDTCFIALNTDISDYEDAVLATCAAEARVDYIATRDAGFIAASSSPVPAMRPIDILGLMEHGK